MKLIVGGHNLASPAHSISQDSFRMLGNHAPLVRKANNGQLFGVFDGISTLSQGGEAARYMGDQLATFFNEHNENNSGDHLKSILTQANNDIASWPVPPNSKSTRAGGCAGSVAWINDSQVYIFHGGDTTALILGSDYQTEEDHTVLSICQNTKQHGLFNFWGIGRKLILEHKQAPFVEDDLLLLSTDGFTDVFSNEEISRAVRNMDYFTAEECEKTCRNLCQQARSRGSGDDVTILLVYREE